MHLTHIVSHEWYDELLSVTTAPAFPAEPIPVRPGPPPEGASKEELTAHDKEVSRYEKELLAMNEDVGGDPTRWWGHCHLENDWDGAWPSETDPKNLPAPFEHFQPTVWAKNDARGDLFKDVLVVDFRGREDAVRPIPHIRGSFAHTLVAGQPCSRARHSRRRKLLRLQRLPAGPSAFDGL